MKTWFTSLLCAFVLFGCSHEGSDKEHKVKKKSDDQQKDENPPKGTELPEKETAETGTTKKDESPRNSSNDLNKFLAYFPGGKKIQTSYCNKSDGTKTNQRPLDAFYVGQSNGTWILQLEQGTQTIKRVLGEPGDQYEAFFSNEKDELHIDFQQGPDVLLVNEHRGNAYLTIFYDTNPTTEGWDVSCVYM